MVVNTRAFSTALHARCSTGASGVGRRNEPVTTGVPLPVGLCKHQSDIRIIDAAGLAVPVQVEVLEAWPDGSIRWALLDLKVNVPGQYALHTAVDGPPSPPERVLEVTAASHGIDVNTGIARFHVPDAGDTLLHELSGQKPGRQVAVHMLDADGRAVRASIVRVSEETAGPLRTTLKVEGVLGEEAHPQLLFTARLHFFTESACVRLEFSVRNPRRALHADGFWELGDAGSLSFRDISLRVQTSEMISTVHCVPEIGSPGVTVGTPVRLYQESSGGENWASTNHVNRNGEMPLSFKGYRFDADGSNTTGLRATPVFSATHEGHATAVAVRHFWQNFPKALEADRDGLTIRLFPGQFPDLHELQGGEQKTHVVGLSFGIDAVGGTPLEWVLDPAVLSAEPAWYALSEAVPYLTPASQDPNLHYLDLVNAAVDGSDSFERKREAIDEYGWRNFGDIYADHEAVTHTAGRPLVSHYNNQYDAVAGLGIHFMRSGDLRWWPAMMELAAHVVDIDLYHTVEDRAVYNGGLFWHTFHYKDAGRSTHRTYPRVDGVPGGGPANEHNYSTGLMLHYLLTGNQGSREGVLQLAEWVIAMDDGDRTIFRWLARGDTGCASATVSTDYHGPGRGAANSIATLLNAFRLTQDKRFLEKAESLIRRCVHPDDDVEGRNLLDVEPRWSYTVFLQVLGRYLDEKILRGEIDDRYGYARASLLRYAAWMADHEYPYLDKPEILEYPNETWAAQEMRKSDVFKFGARHATGRERERFLERSEFFFRNSVDTLRLSPTRTLARPVVLMLSYGHMHAAFSTPDRLAPAPEAPAECDFGPPSQFVPQKQIAKRRAVTLVGAGLTVLVVGLSWILTLR